MVLAEGVGFGVSGLLRSGLVFVTGALLFMHGSLSMISGQCFARSSGCFACRI